MGRRRVQFLLRALCTTYPRASYQSRRGLRLQLLYNRCTRTALNTAASFLGGDDSNRGEGFALSIGTSRSSDRDASLDAARGTPRFSLPFSIAGSIRTGDTCTADDGCEHWVGSVGAYLGTILYCRDILLKTFPNFQMACE